MKIIFIGKIYLDDIRDCCELDLESMQERHFLSTEERIKKALEDTQGKDQYRIEHKVTY